METSFTPLLVMKSKALLTLAILWNRIFPLSGLGNLSPGNIMWQSQICMLLYMCTINDTITSHEKLNEPQNESYYDENAANSEQNVNFIAERN